MLSVQYCEYLMTVYILALDLVANNTQTFKVKGNNKIVFGGGH